MAEMSHYLQYRKNIHSQWGEDGVIAQLLLELGVEGGYCCECGANDGVRLSNTLALAERGGWKALFLESDQQYGGRLKSLAGRFAGSRHEIVDVAANGPNSLDNILRRHGWPTDLDVLSIDIEMQTYPVWAGLRGQPKILVIEINNATDRQDVPAFERTGRSTLADMVAMGRAKGYTCVCVTPNVFLVRDDLIEHLSIPPDELQRPFDMFITDREGDRWAKRC